MVEQRVEVASVQRSPRQDGAGVVDGEGRLQQYPQREAELIGLMPERCGAPR